MVKHVLDGLEEFRYGINHGAFKYMALDFGHTQSGKIISK
jgi:hypothetical protein